MVFTHVIFAVAMALQTVPTDHQEPTRVDDVTVRAEAGRQAAREQIEGFVDTATKSPRGRPLARWSDPVCIAAINFQPEFGRALIDRVARRMVESGLDVKEEGCRPDLLIIGTDDGKGLARTLVSDDAQRFRPSRANTDLGSAALQDFQETDSPIRWWHISLPVSVDTGEIAIKLDGETEPPAVYVRDASRLRSNIRDDLKRVIIIIEPSRLEGVRGTALADYVAFVSMAQVTPNAKMENFDSILNLLHDPESYDELTLWDQDFLAGLYAVSAARLSQSQQRNDVVGAVLRRRDAEIRVPVSPQ